MKTGIRFARTIKVALLCAWACFVLAQNPPQPHARRPIQKILNRADAAFYTGRKQERLTHWDSAANWYGKAIALYRKALVQSTNIGDSQGMAQSNTSIGLTLDNMGRQEDALVYFNKALPQWETNRLGRAATLNDVGKANKELGRFDAALKAYNESLALRQKTGDRQGEAMVLNNIGRVYVEQNRLPEARHQYDDALLIERQLNSRPAMAITLKNYALALARQNQPELA